MGRSRLTLANKRNKILTRHLSTICGLSTASSKNDITSLDFIFHSAKKSNKTTSHYSNQNSFNKKIKGFQNIEEFLGKQVNLKTYVKVIEDWREKEKYLKELGFYELNN